MRVTSPSDTLGRSLVKGAAQFSRAIEKCSPASALDRQPQGTPHAEAKKPPRIQVELVCHDGTDGFDPKWDGPRLLPAFVAQVMGQVMDQERRTHVALETAYGTARLVRTALLLDRKS